MIIASIPAFAAAHPACRFPFTRLRNCKTICIIERDPLQSRQIILQGTTTAKRAQYKTFIEKVPILEQLTEYEKLTIADALAEDSYEDEDVVCTQGEVGDAFYIIKEVRYFYCAVVSRCFRCICEEGRKSCNDARIYLDFITALTLQDSRTICRRITANT